MFMNKCGAKARTNGHQSCRQPAMKNGRCRLHGGKSLVRNPGPKTEEGRIRQHRSSWKHGLFSKQARDDAKSFKNMIQKHKTALKGLEEML